MNAERSTKSRGVSFAMTPVMALVFALALIACNTNQVPDPKPDPAY